MMVMLWGDDPVARTSRLTAASRVFTCGTRTVIHRGPADYRVVCATCEAGGSKRHETERDAAHAAIRDSDKACRKCGAS